MPTAKTTPEPTGGIDALLSKYDVNGDGKYGASEVRLMAADLQQEARALQESKVSRSRLFKILIGVGTLLLISFFVNFALTFTAINLAKDVKSSSGIITDTSGSALHTGEASVLVAKHAATRRRLREHNGRRLVDVAEVAGSACAATVALGRATGKRAGTATVSESGVTTVSQVLAGAVISEQTGSLPAATSSVFTLADPAVPTKPVYVTVPESSASACAVSVAAPSRLRELRLTPDELEYFRKRRRALEALRAKQHGGGISERLLSAASDEDAATALGLNDTFGIGTSNLEDAGSQLVVLADGTPSRIDALKEGDAILAATKDGRLTVDTVSRFSIADRSRSASFLSITTEAIPTSEGSSDLVAEKISHKIELTLGHHLPTGPDRSLKQAKDVVVGDILWRVVDSAAGTLRPVRVVSIDVTIAHGLHNPLMTFGSQPIVNGFATSFNNEAIVTIDSFAVPVVEALCAATGTCALARRAIAAVECTAKHAAALSAKQPAVCKTYHYIDGVVVSGAQPADVAAALATFALSALAVGAAMRSARK